MTDILAVGSHPDDVDFAVGGILARSSAAGKEIVIADLSLGEKGSHGNPAMRTEEAIAAAKIIGATRVQLSFPDCGIFDNEKGRLEIVRLIRHYRPKLILAPLWHGARSHPDHIATGKLLRAASRLARFPKILPELAPHTVEGILHYTSIHTEECDFLIDVTPFVPTWEEMILCHQSQLKTRNYHHWCLTDAGRWGAQIGVPYAQRLIKSNPIYIEDLSSISRGTLEL